MCMCRVFILMAVKYTDTKTTARQTHHQMISVKQPKTLFKTQYTRDAMHFPCSHHKQENVNVTLGSEEKRYTSLTSLTSV